jgi:hypothetical protein
VDHRLPARGGDRLNRTRSRVPQCAIRSSPAVPGSPRMGHRLEAWAARADTVVGV